MPASMESLHCRDCSPQYAGNRPRTGMGLGSTPAAPGIFSHAKCHATSRTIVCSVKDRGLCSQNKRRIKLNRGITLFCGHSQMNIIFQIYGKKTQNLFIPPLSQEKER